MKVYGVIMAGGGGTRFWPLSRKNNPKQLLNLSGKDVMVNETVNRILRVADREDIYIVTNKSQAEKMSSVVLGKIPLKNILSEPSARNTSACIGYSAIKILKEKGDGVMIVTPSDAYISDEEEYARILKTAVDNAEKTDKIITIGIKPTFPSTGYGYINFGKDGKTVKKVVRFVEKPSEEKATDYIISGDYAWNSGVFIFKASVILNNIKKFLPEIYEKLSVISDSIGREDEFNLLEQIYPTIPSVSIDYGVMEKSEDINVILGDFGWNDVGSFEMMNILHNPDKNGNIVIGDGLMVESKNSTVYSNGRTVAVLGMDDVVVVETKDAVLVCPKARAQEVKKIVDILKENGREELL